MTHIDAVKAVVATHLSIDRHSLGERIRGALLNLRHLLNSAHHPLRDRGMVVGLFHRPPAVTLVEPTAPPARWRGG